MTDMDIDSVNAKLHQARSFLDEMRACKGRAFGDKEALALEFRNARARTRARVSKVSWEMGSQL
jgi:hypothetical protein